jgi:hypothetical protein
MKVRLQLHQAAFFSMKEAGALCSQLVFIELFACVDESIRIRRLSFLVIVSIQIANVWENSETLKTCCRRSLESEIANPKLCTLTFTASESRIGSEAGVTCRL